MAIVTLAHTDVSEVRLSVILEHENLRRLLDGRPFFRPAIPTRPDIAVAVMSVEPSQLEYDPAFAIVPRKDGCGWLVLVQAGPATWRAMLGDGSAESSLELHGEAEVDGVKWTVRVCGTPDADIWTAYAQRIGALRATTRIIDERFVQLPSVN